MPLCIKTPREACEESDIASLGLATDLSMPLFCAYFKERCRGAFVRTGVKSSSTVPQGGLMHGILWYEGGKAAAGHGGSRRGFSSYRTFDRDNPVLWPPFRPRSAHKVIIIFHRLWGAEGVSHSSVPAWQTC